MSNLPNPVKVDPLIKLCRYAFLVAGIFYGAQRHARLKIKEAGAREEEAKKKIERDAKLAEEKEAAIERDIAELLAIFRPKSKTNTGDSPHKNEAIPETTQETKVNKCNPKNVSENPENISTPSLFPKPSNTIKNSEENIKERREENIFSEEGENKNIETPYFIDTIPHDIPYLDSEEGTNPKIEVDNK